MNSNLFSKLISSHTVGQTDGIQTDFSTRDGTLNGL